MCICIRMYVSRELCKRTDRYAYPVLARAWIFTKFSHNSLVIGRSEATMQSKDIAVAKKTKKYQDQNLHYW